MKVTLFMVAFSYNHSQRPNEYGMLPIKYIHIGSKIQPKKKMNGSSQPIIVNIMVVH